MRNDEHATIDRGDGGSDPGAMHLELSRMLLGGEPLSRIADRVAHWGKITIPGIDEVSVTVVEDGAAHTVAFTGQLAAQLDERQYERGFGPCLDAARTGEAVQIPDTSTESTYPDFARQAARNGVTRSMSVGMPVPGRTVGGLNLYARSGTGFDEQTVAAATTFAEHAAVALANAALQKRAAEQVDQLREAMASRSVIEQAKGMIMAAEGCTADEAFTLLSQRASQGNRKVRVVAQAIVDGHGRGL